MLKDILDKCLDLRTKLEHDQEEYLFCPLALKNPSETQLLNVMKNYWRIRKTARHCKFQWRQIQKSYEHALCLNNSGSKC